MLGELGCLCLRRFDPLYCGAAEQPALPGAEIGPRMVGAPVVPRDEITRCPFVLINHFCLFRMVEQTRQDFPAFFFVKPDKSTG